MACEDCKGYGPGICNKAARNGHLACLIWARRNGYKWDEHTCLDAAMEGHLECLIWAGKNGCPMDRMNIYIKATHNKHLKILWWMSKNKDYDLCSHAAEKGYLDILIWARRNEYKWDEYTCLDASSEGHLECLKWARKNGCPWDERTCAWAAMNGHLECLIWATRNGCPWDKWIYSGFDAVLHTLIWVWQNNYHLNINMAVEYGNLDILMWARKVKHLDDWSYFDGEVIIEEGNLSSLIWIKKCDYSLNKSICLRVARTGRLDILIWAWENEYPCSKWVCFEATTYGNCDILKWIHAHGSPCDCGKEVYIEWNGWKDEGREDCAICMEKLDDSTVKFCGCRHHYHRDCMDEMLRVREREGKKRCSICDRGT